MLRPAHVSKPSVLIVDDDIANVQYMSAILGELGYITHTAMDGRCAAELIAEYDIRIVLSNWDLPDMAGMDLCSRIRQRRFSDYVYFILLATMDRQSECLAALEGGADDFLYKPCLPNEVSMRLKVAERIISLEKKHLLVFSLAKLAESRDNDTGTHLERIRDYCWLLAKQLSATDKYRDEINNDYIRALYLTSPLHDIGKVGIPDAVLLKPGKLTSEEFDVMKTHTTIGQETLDAALAADPDAQYLQLASEIAGSHHERFDGTGYPLGLKGEEIPLSARIVALADVYDALTTKRIYKPAFTHEKARSIIVEERGKHFDPDCVDAFLQCETQFLLVRANENLQQGFGNRISPVGVAESMVPLMSFVSL